MRSAKNGRLSIGGDTMDYIRFGTGQKVLVILPGVGDGFQTVKGTALPFALLYRRLEKDFTVYVFSRRNNLAPHTTTREMADDLSRALTQLSLRRASVVGISQGGMIAQWLAIDHPEQVERLVLTVTAGRSNPTMRTVIGRWIEQAKQGDYRGILLDSAQRSYSPKKLPGARAASELLGRFGKPKSFDRFIIQAESCLSHDAHSVLIKIVCPTLVIGGTEDGIVTGAASEELAAEIPGAELFLYEGLSHALYEEAPDYLERVRQFCGKQSIE